MITLRQKTGIYCTGALWLILGTFLLSKGGQYLFSVFSSSDTLSYPLITKLVPYVKSKEQAALLLFAFGLGLGIVKGKWVFTKTVQKVVGRILSLPNPMPLKELYHKRYYGLILLMMGLGMGLNRLGVPLDIRGVVDVAIGSALIQGARLYLRHAQVLQ